MSLESIMGVLSPDELKFVNEEDETTEEQAVENDEKKTEAEAQNEEKSDDTAAADSSDATTAQNDDPEVEESTQDGGDDVQQNDQVNEKSSNDEDEDEGDDDAAEQAAAANQPTFSDLPNLQPLQKAVEDATQERKQIIDQYEDGDLSEEEYRQQIDAVEDKITDAKSDLKLANRDHEKINKAWGDACRSYLKNHMPGLSKDEAMLTAFDGTVRAITSQPAFAQLSFEQILRQAHANLEFNAEALGLKNVPPVANRKPAKKTEKKPETKKKAEKETDKTDLGKTPTTLADVPASDVAAVTDDGSFASLAKLQDTDPLKFEAALAQLPDDQRDAFLSYTG